MSEQSYRCLSPCKINLFLYITGKRDDGYHNLQTLFRVLDFGDEMEFWADESGEIRLLTDFGFPVEDNLIYKAALALKPFAQKNCGVRIAIDKKMPKGGGLGAGSANAATTLKALNKLWQLNLDEAVLIKIATKLGADVPIFIKDCDCFAEGIGEILTKVRLPQKWYLICTPPCQVPTAKLFADPLLKKDSPKLSFEELCQRPFENCFTPCVLRNYPQVFELLNKLSEFAPSFMSGSGSSCFIELPNRLSAEKIHSKLQEYLKENKVFSFIATVRNAD